jgi:hypothetical protein
MFIEYLFVVIILNSFSKYSTNIFKAIKIREGINQYELGNIIIGKNIKIQFN